MRDAVAAALNRDRLRTQEQARLKRLYRLEADLYAAGCAAVAGIDEVGRGALAGPLTAGACVLPAKPRIVGLNDSKKLTPAARERLAVEIRQTTSCWAVAHVPPSEVDELGMTAALRKAMTAALAALPAAADHVVVDGRPVGVFSTETAIVGGDAKVAAIAAASILAKVARDALMVELAETHPEFGFEINKGYGTPEHLVRSTRTAPHRSTVAPSLSGEGQPGCSEMRAVSTAVRPRPVSAKCPVPACALEVGHMSKQGKRLGQRGEDAAAAYLERVGMTVVERNWRCPSGEIDLVALEDETLVLCEVKTRRSTAKGTPEDSVTPAKQRRYKTLARAYVQQAGLVTCACASMSSRFW